MRRFVWILILAGAPGGAAAQQVVDTAFVPPAFEPAFPMGTGPTVLIDQRHNNPALDGPLSALASVLAADGFDLREWGPGPDLDRADAVVVVDPLAERNVGNWTLPTPSAFAASEVERLVDFVRRGGGLLLVADHMPFAGAARALATALGVELLNGFAIDTVTWDPITFRRSDGSLTSHPVLSDEGLGPPVDSVSTYWGHALRPRVTTLHPLFVLPRDVVSFQPDEAWEFVGVETLDVEGWTQGVAGTVGEGRVVVLGDSGMLMAHLVGENRTPVGLNSPSGWQNVLLLRRILRWLTE
ncbi:MAG: DUF4350 domain-containing protein [Halobacteriales archaeon]|nr:DUF4350 domain-containing protein [Halobacteriales archaeon]